LMVTISQS